LAIEPVFRAGETYPLPGDISRDDAFAYWRASGNEVFVAEDGGRIVGTYYLRANNHGGGSHVANCGYIVAADASRRGLARAMCVHSLEDAPYGVVIFRLCVSDQHSLSPCNLRVDPALCQAATARPASAIKSSIPG